MPSVRTFNSRVGRIVLIAAAIALAVILVACGNREPREESLGPGEPPVLSAPDLSTPESAVRSYLDWVSLAYRLANSEVSTQTHTLWEGVRVDSYIELNRQQGRGIEQYIDVFEKRSEATAEPTATISAYEEWRYRYFSLDALEYLGPEYRITYDTTYTVVFEDGRWLVDSVEANALTPVE